MNLTEKFRQLKANGKKWTVVTSYDYWSATILNKTNVDALLVGDCAAMVMHGEQNTLNADAEMLTTHTKAVVKGAPDKFIITALPFMTGKKSLKEGLETVEKFVKAGTHAVKIEGGFTNENFIKNILSLGVPVVGHIGLKPTHIHMLQGFKVQGKKQKEVDLILLEGKMLQDAGCTCVVLEAVPPSVGKQLTEQLAIPVIGIGAGADVDGHGLVFQDMLGLTTDFKPKFVRQYINGADLVMASINHFVRDVNELNYPKPAEMYLPKEKKVPQNLDKIVARGLSV